MRAIKVEVDYKILSPFRRAAIRHAKNEKEYIQAFLSKKVNNKYRIVEFHKLKIVSASGDSVEIDRDSLESIKALAKQKGLLFSTIHTHFETSKFYAEITPSHQDYLDAIDNKEHLIGICLVSKSKSGRYKTEIKFWYPQTCILNIK